MARGVTGVQPITAVEEVQQQDAKDITWSITQPLASCSRAGRRSSPPLNLKDHVREVISDGDGEAWRSTTCPGGSHHRNHRLGRSPSRQSRCAGERRCLKYYPGEIVEQPIADYVEIIKEVPLNKDQQAQKQVIKPELRSSRESKAWLCLQHMTRSSRCWRSSIASHSRHFCEVRWSMDKCVKHGSLSM